MPSFAALCTNDRYADEPAIDHIRLSVKLLAHLQSGRARYE
ncbi:hypothetical protein BOA8489_03890 [Boseongicola aestuarii]|uniref:Uncharacterized protein n=1 Tax=Boseongicola aestuarii TaxID=1470561 RepID=A0A238J510_9RHOB|nr:hypothetical protein BOA8489_03890 [Boseongicola aestuarii]